MFRQAWIPKFENIIYLPHLLSILAGESANQWTVRKAPPFWSFLRKPVSMEEASWALVIALAEQYRDEAWKNQPTQQDFDTKKHWDVDVEMWIYGWSKSLWEVKEGYFIAQNCNREILIKGWFCKGSWASGMNKKAMKPTRKRSYNSIYSRSLFVGFHYLYSFTLGFCAY